MLSFVTGDATSPDQPGPKIIAHVCNDAGGWGKGFVTAVSRRWKEPELRYRAWYRDRDSFGLGEVQLVEVEPELTVANMVAQHGYRSTGNPVPLRHDALQRCLATLTEQARELGATVHMPRIGCGLAGGRWPDVQDLIERTLIAGGVPTTVYDLTEPAPR